MQHRLMKPLDDAIGLWRLDLRLGVVDVIDGQVQLVIVCFPFTAVFSATVGQHSQQRQLVLNEQWQNPVIEKIGDRYRRFGRVQLGTGHLGVGIHESLLAMRPTPFRVPA